MFYMQASHSSSSAAGPNPSVKRRANGKPPGPRAAVVYPASRGPGGSPSAPAYLER